MTVIEVQVQHVLILLELKKYTPLPHCVPG